jgi:hypothetical protein
MRGEGRQNGRELINLLLLIPKGKKKPGSLCGRALLKGKKLF